MEFGRNDSEGAELYCTEKSAFTPFPSSDSQQRKWENPKHVASTPYHPAPPMSEKYDDSNQITDSADDPLLNDLRVIQYMIERELNSDRTSSRYLRTTHVNDNMRKILLRWMYEVVIDQKCEDLLFVLAANFLDRFLNSVPVEKGQLQLLGCCCLLLASKLRNSHIISADMLAYLTDGCHTDDDICKFELVVLSQLGWNMSPILPSDYLEPVIRQVGVGHVPAIQRHARSFLSMATLYACFLDYRPSFLGCAAVYAGLTYCDGRDAEELLLLNFVEKTFSISRQDMARARALIFSSMETELSLQSDEDQDTVVLPAFEDRRDGPSDHDTSCSEVSSTATFDVQAGPLTIMSWLSNKASFLKLCLFSSALPILSLIATSSQQLLDDNQLKYYRVERDVRRNLFHDWSPACEASMLALLVVLKTGSRSSIWKKVIFGTSRIPAITEEFKGEVYAQDEKDTSIMNFETDAVMMNDCDDAGCQKKEGLNNSESDINGNFVNCINFEEERFRYCTKIRIDKC